MPTIDLPADDLQLARLLAGSRLDGKGGWTLLELEELNAAWETLAAQSTNRSAEFIPLPLVTSDVNAKQNEFRAPVQGGPGSSRSSRGNEAHSEKSEIPALPAGGRTPNSEIDQSLVTSAATSLRASLLGPSGQVHLRNLPIWMRVLPRVFEEADGGLVRTEERGRSDPGDFGGDSFVAMPTSERSAKTKASYVLVAMTVE